jgi:drug/metabolite transporter (DMT)-like permease
MTATRPKIPPALVLLTGTIAVSFAGILIKNCDMDAEAMAMFRMLGGGLVLLPLAWPHLKRELPALSRKSGIFLFLAGCFLAVHFIFWMESLKRTSVASATMTLATQPIFAAIIGHFFIGEKFRFSTAVALVITIAGLGIIGLTNYQRGMVEFEGVVLAVLSALFMTAVLACGKVVRPHMHILSYSSSLFLIAGLLLVPTAFKFAGEIGTYAPRQWFFMALIIFVPTLMGHTLFYWAVRYIKVITVNLTALAEPVIATIGAMFLVFPAEFPQPLFYAGGAILILGVAYHVAVESREKVLLVPPTE